MASRTASAQAPNPRPGSAARPDRKLDILLAAEKLFAERGYHAVTIRQIADEARVPLALVGYYYGPKHELFHAIFEHWSYSIQERLAALERVAADARSGAGGADTLTRIIEAFTEPVIRLRASAEGEYYALLVARELHYARAESDRVLRAYFDPLAHAFIDAIGAQFPQANRGQVAWCYQFALGALLHHLSDDRVERLSLGACHVGDAAGAQMLVPFIVGGIKAALPASPGPDRPPIEAPLKRNRRQ